MIISILLASYAHLNERISVRLQTPRNNRVSYHCNGTENHLTECDHSDFLFHDCAGRISAGIICSSMFHTTLMYSKCLFQIIHVLKGRFIYSRRLPCVNIQYHYYT